MPISNEALHRLSQTKRPEILQRVFPPVALTANGRSFQPNPTLRYIRRASELARDGMPYWP